MVFDLFRKTIMNYKFYLEYICQNRVFKMFPYLKVNYKLLLAFCCMLSMPLYGQLDSQENSTTIEAEDDKKAKDPSIIVKPFKSEGLSNVNKGKINGLSVPQNEGELNLPEEEFSMFVGEKFANPADLFKKQLKHNLKIKEEAEVRQYGHTTNQYLGDFKTGAVFVNVVYRDHEYPDGDRIRVFVNGLMA